MSETTHTHIEDALKAGSSAVDPETVLDDEQLRDGGLVPVRTWVRTRASSNAIRAKKSREKAERGEGGAARKQLSLLAPPDDGAREALRELGKRMVEGEVTLSDIQGIGGVAQPQDSVEQRVGRRALDLMRNGGFRGRILRHLLSYRGS